MLLMYIHNRIIKMASDSKRVNSNIYFIEKTFQICLFPVKYFGNALDNFCSFALL